MGFSGNYLPLSYKEIGPHSITGQGQQSTGELMCLVNKAVPWKQQLSLQNHPERKTQKSHAGEMDVIFGLGPYILHLILPFQKCIWSGP